MTQKGKPVRSRPKADEGLSLQRARLIELFFLFSQLGLSSFGGSVSAWMHRAFVEQRAWIGQNEFSTALAVSRIMPGANVVNLAIFIGQRLRGSPGAVAAASGLLVGPSFLIIALAIIYRQLAGTMILDKILQGTAAAAVGLLIAMAVSSGRHLISVTARSPARMIRNITAVALVIAIFLLIGVLRFPMVPTVLCLAPLSIALAYVALRKPAMEKVDARR
jgi:chromate transporter